MKHDVEFTNAGMAQWELPNAPMAMPKQMLERPQRRFISSLRLFFQTAFSRS